MLKWISIICVSAYLGGCKQRPENSDSETLTASSINNTSLLREGDEMQCSIAELGAENVSRCDDIANDFARSSELRSINFLISCGGELFDVQIEGGRKGTRTYNSVEKWQKDGLVQAAKRNGHKCTVKVAN